MTTREQLRDLVERAPDNEVEALLIFALFVQEHKIVLPASALQEALQGMDWRKEDDALTPGDIAALEAAKADPRPGLTTTTLCRELGLSVAEAAQVRARLLPFEEDWNAPGMEAYDALIER